jgi:type I restriction enzyme S subunit
MQLLEHFKELTINPKNAKELKGLILQLAIQGKLTDNWRKENPNVESASILLCSIIDYNKTLLKSKNKRIKKLPIESGVTLELLNGWIQTKNHVLFSLTKGKNPKDLSESKKKYPYQDIESLARGNVRRYSDDEKAVKCTDEDILVVCDGSRSGLLLEGKVGIVGSTLAIIETAIFIQEYVKLLFLQDYERANSSMKGAAIPHLDTKALLNFDIGLPPLEEQKEIVKVVEILFREVEELEQLTFERIALKEDFVTSALNQLTTNNANQEWPFLQDHFKNFFNETRNIKKLRETVLQLAVQGKLTADWRANNPDTEDASILLKHIQKEKAQLVKDKEIKKGRSSDTIITDNCDWVKPNNWVEIELQDLFKFIDYRGKTPVKSKSGKRLITAKNIRMGFIKNDPIEYVSELFYKNWMVRGFPEKGNILFVTEGHTMGFVTQINLDYEFALAQRTICFQPFYSMDLTFYYYAIMSQQFQQIIFDNQTGSAASGIKASKLKRIPIPLPPLEEQKVIVQKVNALMGLCDSLEQEVQESQEQIAQLMQSCLREVFEGEK